MNRAPFARSSTTWLWATGCLLIVLMVFAVWLPWRKPELSFASAQPIELQINPLPAFERWPRMFGPLLAPTLNYRGGLDIQSDGHRLGGLSTLVLADDGGLVAVSDLGYWFSASIVRDNHGRVTGLAQAMVAPLYSSSGKTLRTLGRGDVEALAVGPGRAYLAHESYGSGIWVLDSTQPLWQRPATMMNTPPAIAGLPKGRGIESLVRLAANDNGDDRLLAIAELDPSGSNDIPAWLLVARGNKLSASDLRFAVTPGFAITDAAYHPACGLFWIERRLTWWSGFQIHLKRSTRLLQPGQLVQGEVLLDATNLNSNVGNMEGLSVRPAHTGQCELFMVSDDNFLPLQKTLLLQFIFVPPEHRDAGSPGT